MRLIELPPPIGVWADTSKRVKLAGVPDDVAEQLIAYRRHGARDIHIAASDTPTPVTLNLQDVDAVRGVFLYLDSGFDLAINGSVTLLSFRRLDERPENTTEKLRALLQCAITSLAITNPSDTVALTGYMIWWGDAA